jgi:alkanesulfonate monooxygenase SsuD/methylene tetrahydromethanopterin reductase-like flavin-dependent oxidoreductase (luciferase family)
MTGRPLRFSISGSMGYASFGDLLEKCALAEELGFSAFYASDHMHGVAGAPVDAPFLEPWTLLAGLAARTSRLRLGCLVAGVTYRHPSMLAKIAGTLDVISEGRLELGLGAAWSPEDHHSYGLDFPGIRERLGRLEEAVDVIYGLWTNDRFSYEGEYYSVRDAPFEPRTVQSPPPLLLAGASPRLLDLVARRAHSWVSVSSPGLAGRCTQQIAERCAKVGRDPSEIDCGQSFALLLSDDASRVADVLAARSTVSSEHRAQRRTTLDGEPDEEAVRAGILAGNPDEVIARLRQYVDAGVNHFIFQTPLPVDRAMLRRFSEEVVPAVRAT